MSPNRPRESRLRARQRHEVGRKQSRARARIAPTMAFGGYRHQEYKPSPRPRSPCRWPRYPSARRLQTTIPCLPAWLKRAVARRWPISWPGGPQMAWKRRTSLGRRVPTPGCLTPGDRAWPRAPSRPLLRVAADPAASTPLSLCQRAGTRTTQDLVFRL